MPADNLIAGTIIHLWKDKRNRLKQWKYCTFWGNYICKNINNKNFEVGINHVLIYSAFQRIWITHLGCTWKFKSDVIRSLSFKAFWGCRNRLFASEGRKRTRSIHLHFHPPHIITCRCKFMCLHLKLLIVNKTQNNKIAVPPMISSVWYQLPSEFRRRAAVLCDKKCLKDRQRLQHCSPYRQGVEKHTLM